MHRINPQLYFIRASHRSRETDFLKPYGLELLESCVDPVVIHHPKGHTIPRFDEKGLESVMSFLERIQRMLPEKQEKEIYSTATEDALEA
ncbi:hypothetical protein QQP08_023478 [Theobroma cacao]|nr:hypothetical protein QQP08_023478 [Theobroma cacao]